MKLIAHFAHHIDRLDAIAIRRRILLVKSMEHQREGDTLVIPVMVSFKTNNYEEELLLTKHCRKNSFKTAQKILATKTTTPVTTFCLFYSLHTTNDVFTRNVFFGCNILHFLEKKTSNLIAQYNIYNFAFYIYQSLIGSFKIISVFKCFYAVDPQCDFIMPTDRRSLVFALSTFYIQNS